MDDIVERALAACAWLEQEDALTMPACIWLLPAVVIVKEMCATVAADEAAMRELKERNLAEYVDPSRMDRNLAALTAFIEAVELEMSDGDIH